LDPHETSCKDICTHLASHLAFETIVTLPFSTAKLHHVNMHVTITRHVALLNFGFPLRSHASAFRLHAKRRNERASVSKGLLHESHQLFRRVIIIRFAPHAVTFLPVPYQKQLLCAVHLAAQTSAWTTFSKRGRLGSISAWLLTVLGGDCVWSHSVGSQAMNDAHRATIVGP
jgi:hypothetical protein